MKILLIDDHHLIRDMLGEFLADKLNASITYAQNGSDALELFFQDSFDLLLTDVNMPGISGIEVVKRVRAQNSSIKIVALSMIAHISSVESMQQAGANAYVVKDGEMEPILSVIRQVLDGKYVFPKTGY